ncbi:MAG: arylsulfatase [Eudoraea sp.]|nr:arylsulfatase [Eudoraea sp.]
MRITRYIFFFVIVLLTAACGSADKKKVETTAEVGKPNIIYILADDLGYGELGVYGQEKIETPNLDALAKEGMLFTQHYTSAPVCAPARYMLMTGQHSGRAHIRGNEEWAERGDVWDYIAMAKDSVLEGQRPMPANTVTLPIKLKEVGYTTGMIGKWGLGAPHTHSIPTIMGFDFFYGYNCQRQAHTYYPLHLYKNEKRVHLANDTIPPNTPLADGADPQDPLSYANYNLTDYAPELMFEELTAFVDRSKEKPFFLYWATPIPHVAIQAPEHWVNYYIKKFGKERPYLGGKGKGAGYFPHKNPRAGYAAMISYLDENVGKLVNQLKAAGIYENTLIIFTSDNGPSFAGGADPEWFQSAQPFEGTFGRGKGFVYEGGIRVPMIASWPNRIKAGTTTDHISVHYDVMETLAELTGFEAPDNDGTSFLPTLLSEEDQEEHEFLLWEFPEYGGQLAIRMGDWKVVMQQLKSEKDSATLELYNLETDPTEQNDLAAAYPEIIQKAATIFRREHRNATINKFRIRAIENGLVPQNEE